MRNLFWHTVTSFTKAKREGHGGITDALLEFDRYKVWEETESCSPGTCHRVNGQTPFYGVLAI